MRLIIGILLCVFAIAAFPNGRAQGQRDDYLPNPTRLVPAPYIAMPLPTTGDPRTDLIALMTLSATLLTLAESVQKRSAGNTSDESTEGPLFVAQPDEDEALTFNPLAKAHAAHPDDLEGPHTLITERQHTA